MDVAPHPHIGLQTVSWLPQGEILHNDSLSNEPVLQPAVTAALEPLYKRRRHFFNLLARARAELADCR